MRTDLTITEVFPAGLAAFGAVPVFSPASVSAVAKTCKPSRPRVLCFSRAEILGETRRAILQRRFDTVLVHSLEEVCRLPLAQPFDAVVLCHTLSLLERARCLAMAKCAWPMAKVVLVGVQGEPSEEGCDRTVLGLAGPEALLAAVQQVLRPAVSFAELSPS